GCGGARRGQKTAKGRWFTSHGQFSLHFPSSAGQHAARAPDCGAHYRWGRLDPTLWRRDRRWANQFRPLPASANPRRLNYERSAPTKYDFRLSQWPERPTPRPLACAIERTALALSRAEEVVADEAEPRKRTPS